ncbi:MAG: hypothetical protein R6U61_02610 [Thermoplasmata archaeon]
MKGYSEVKLLRFEGKGAHNKCEKTINAGIEHGWQPINMCTHISPQTGELIITVLMGNIKEKEERKEQEEEIEAETEEQVEYVEETEEEKIEEEPEEVVEVVYVEEDEAPEEEEIEAEEIIEEEGVEEEAVTEEDDVWGEKEVHEEKKKKFSPGSLEICPKCGNKALEVEIDRSAHCEFCGYIVRDIRKIKED